MNIDTIVNENLSFADTTTHIIDMIAERFNVDTKFARILFVKALTNQMVVGDIIAEIYSILEKNG